MSRIMLAEHHFPLLRGRCGSVSGVLMALALLFAGSGALAGDARAPGVPGVLGGVVATSEPAAAEAGAGILRRGGNAIDAASAVMFALNVVEPQSAGIGGGGFMMIHLAEDNETFVVDSREVAPAGATADMFEGQTFAEASTSGLAVGVPGAVRGVELVQDRWGTMTFSEVLQPAIGLAADGFRISRRLETSIASDRLSSEPGNPAYEVARTVFRPDGQALSEGDLLVQPDLARTLRLLAEEGPDAFYTGPLAEAIVATQRHYRSGNEALSGRMQPADLAAYEPAVRDPVEGDYRGYRVVSMPPPSSGGLTVLAVLKMLERFPIGDADAGFGFGSPRTLHVMTEAMRVAYADRAVWMGDDDFVQVPVRGLLDDTYIARRGALVDPDARQDRITADDPRPFDVAGFRSHGAVASGDVPDTEPVNTTHFSIVDRHGNVVTYTNTIESRWGTGLMVPGYGFLLNNELTDFNFTPQADSDGEVYNPGANDVAPFKRPRSSMAPTMLFHDGEPLAAYGSPGGATIINTVINVTMALLDHGRNAQQAADAPRLSQTSANGPVTLEYGFEESAVQALRDLGHEVRRTTRIGAAQIVVIDPRTGRQYGGADRRRGGAVVSLDEIEGSENARKAAASSIR